MLVCKTRLYTTFRVVHRTHRYTLRTASPIRCFPRTQLACVLGPRSQAHRARHTRSCARGRRDTRSECVSTWAAPGSCSLWQQKDTMEILNRSPQASLDTRGDINWPTESRVNVCQQSNVDTSNAYVINNDNKYFVSLQLFIGLCFKYVCPS